MIAGIRLMTFLSWEEGALSGIQLNITGHEWMIANAVSRYLRVLSSSLTFGICLKFSIISFNHR